MEVLAVAACVGAMASWVARLVKAKVEEVMAAVKLVEEAKESAMRARVEVT